MLVQETGSVSLSPATVYDYERFHQGILSAYEELRPRGIVPMPLDQVTFVELCRSGHAHWFRREEQEIGGMTAWPKGDAMYVDLLFLLPGMRSRGAFRDISRLLKRKYKADGIKELHFYTDEDAHALRALHRSIGARELGRDELLGFPRINFVLPL